MHIFKYIKYTQINNMKYIKSRLPLSEMTHQFHKENYRHHLSLNYKHINGHRIIYLLVMLLTFIGNLQDKLTHACPSDVCICKWKSGKQTVECGGQMLSKLPEGMDPGTQVLNFSSNALQVLQSERFLRMDLINLQKIYLSKNQLIKIHEKAFRGLSNLVELDISDNMLQHIPTETFQDYTSLMRLSLSGNPIRELKMASFRHLSFLTTLELSNCHIERIENEAFIGMDNLEWLRLDGNRIQYIQGSYVLPKSLHGISLQSNRWHCDCRLIDIHAWLVNYNTPESEEPVCLEPIRLKGQQVKSLKKDELACLPEVQPKSTYTEVAEGRNITIQCTVRAIPEPKVLWLFNGQVLTNETMMDNLHMYYYIDDGTASAGEEKHSEVFIYNVGPEDNGTFSCIGQNTAGTTFSNYTLRVITKDTPIVKEVSFAKDYMSYIIISGGGAGFLFVLIVCTIAIKCSCRTKRPSLRNNKSLKQENANNEIGLLKCPSIINEEDMSPKSTKENGVILTGGNCSIGHSSSLGISNGASGQMKQGFMMYVPSLQQNHHLDSANMQLSETSAPTPPLEESSFENISLQGQYCSPPGSVMRHYTDKNPDLVNDAESVKNKFIKQENEYDGSECSVPTEQCSLQSSNGVGKMGPGLTNVLQDSQTFDYQMANQFGSQIIKPSAINSSQRVTTMSTLPRGMHLKSLSNNIVGGGQHQVDVHLNPVCFLSQDTSGYASYELSSNSINIQNSHQQQQPQQQNFYRTLPHNRSGHNNKINLSAANPGTRYSLEAEFLQRSGNGAQHPSLYDKYTVHNMRFSAEGYPIHQQQQHQTAPIAAIVQYPSPPEGYKGGIVDYKENGQTICPATSTSFQQWPPCLPGYHAQPIRYSTTPIAISSPTTNLYGSNSSVNSSSQQQQQQSSQIIQSTALGGLMNNMTNGNINLNGNSHNSNSSSSSSTQTPSPNSVGFSEIKKRCVGAQTTELEPSTILECDEEQELLQSNQTISTTATTNGYSSSPAAYSKQQSSGSLSSSSSKLRHLNGPLADSPDEGYVGDSQDTCSDM